MRIQLHNAAIASVLCFCVRVVQKEFKLWYAECDSILLIWLFESIHPNIYQYSFISIWGGLVKVQSLDVYKFKNIVTNFPAEL